MRAVGITSQQNGGVDELFPDAPKGQAGYDKGEVRDFLNRAKRAYEGIDEGITSSDIRQKVFTTNSKEGFDPYAVDQALWRLEEAFASREREGVTEETGEAGYYKRIRQQAQEILDRVARPRTEKFRRAKALQPGYHPVDVDAFCDRLVRYFQGQEAVSVATVRNQKFRTRLGGYEESQVDRVLDDTVSVILAVR
jgi:DivIVA domain-containing protein